MLELIFTCKRKWFKASRFYLCLFCQSLIFFLSKFCLFSISLILIIIYIFLLNKEYNRELLWEKEFLENFISKNEHISQSKNLHNFLAIWKFIGFKCLTRWWSIMVSITWERLLAVPSLEIGIILATFQKDRKTSARYEALKKLPNGLRRVLLRGHCLNIISECLSQRCILLFELGFLKC